MLNRVAAVAGFLGLWANLTLSPTVNAQASALRIIVVEGEDAVNVIEQKTAVAPVIEVRDRNDQPIAGAVVRFAISRGRATFNGARVLSVTTNAAGRAVATGLTPTGSGALQISAAATFQGQTAAITIAQTNVVAASAAGAGVGGASGGGAGAGGGGASGTGAGAGGAAGGTGGGLSATTIGIVGGAVAGGAIAAKEVLGDDSGLVLYEGPYSGSVNTVFPASLSFCSRATAHAGTVEVDIEVGSDGSVTGQGGVKGTTAMTSFSGGNLCAVAAGTQSHGDAGPISGRQDSFHFQASHPGLLGTTATYEFTGALSGGVVTGTFTFTLAGPDGTDRGVFPVTLRTQQR